MLQWPFHQSVVQFLVWPVARFGVFALSVALMLVLLAAVWAATNRLWIAIWTGLVGSVVVSFATQRKIAARREPIVPADLEFVDNPGFLLGMVSVSTLVWVAAGLVVFSGLLWMVARRATRIWPRPHHRRSRVGMRLMWVRIAVIVLAAVVVWDLLRFNSGASVLRSSYDSVGANWRDANQYLNFRLNGVLGGFASNLKVPAMDPPGEYTEARMLQIRDRYTAKAVSLNSKRSDPRDVNVVLVLGESFADLSGLPGVEASQDPLANYRELARTNTHGKLLVQRVGAGTANVEFEVLTGQSLALFSPQMDTPYSMLVSRQSSFPSFLSAFEKQGFASLALHPYEPNMYHREVVYPILGFDEARFVDDIPRREQLGRNTLTSDSDTFRLLIDSLEGTEEPVFANVVTMQNHFEYSGKYDDPIAVSGLDTVSREQIEPYLRGLSFADEALASLISELESLEERTLLVYYGDHLPAGLSLTDLSRFSERQLRETPFLVYDTDPPGADDTADVVQEAGTVGPPHLLGLALEQAGIAVTPWQAFLSEVHAVIPSMQHGLVVDSTGELVDPAELSGEAQNLLEDYRLLQYDLAVGERYVGDDFVTGIPQRGPSIGSVRTNESP